MTVGMANQGLAYSDDRALLFNCHNIVSYRGCFYDVVRGANYRERSWQWNFVLIFAGIVAGLPSAIGQSHDERGKVK